MLDKLNETQNQVFSQTFCFMNITIAQGTCMPVEFVQSKGQLHVCFSILSCKFYPPANHQLYKIPLAPVSPSSLSPTPVDHRRSSPAFSPLILLSQALTAADIIWEPAKKAFQESKWATRKGKKASCIHAPATLSNSGSHSHTHPFSRYLLCSFQYLSPYLPD